VNILDEDIGLAQCERLTARRIHFRQIGVGVGRSGMKDRDEIIPLLHTRRRPTFFTLDEDFYHPTLCHGGYCLVYFDVDPNEVAHYIRRFLRHKAFRTKAQRMGKVVRVRPGRISYWQVGEERAHLIGW
jgi:hypothetical protein